MSVPIQAPVELVEAVAFLHLPKKADDRLQDLMDRNNDGLLTPEEKEDLEALVQWSEDLSLLRAKALKLLGKKPA